MQLVREVDRERRARDRHEGEVLQKHEPGQHGEVLDEGFDGAAQERATDFFVQPEVWKIAQVSDERIIDAGTLQPQQVVQQLRDGLASQVAKSKTIKKLLKCVKSQCKC